MTQQFFYGENLSEYIKEDLNECGDMFLKWEDPIL
jgi:hypothetical protein